MFVYNTMENKTFIYIIQFSSVVETFFLSHSRVESNRHDEIFPNKSQSLLEVLLLLEYGNAAGLSMEHHVQVGIMAMLLGLAWSTTCGSVSWQRCWA